MNRMSALRIACTSILIIAAAPLAASENFDDLLRVSVALGNRNYNTVHFGFDEDALDAQARAKLQRQADFILRRPDVRFAVTGHTDKVGNPGYNRALGMRRAKRVVAHLVSLGVDPRQLEAMVSLGEERPVVRTEDRERRNRRVVTTVILPRGGNNGGLAGSGSAKDTSVTAAGTGAKPTGSGRTSSSTTTTSTTGSTSTTSGSTATTSPDSGTTTTKPRPGNSAYGTGKPDAGSGNGDEPSGDPAGSIGHNRGGDER